jgi:hypothetical protein
VAFFCSRLILVVRFETRAVQKSRNSHCGPPPSAGSSIPQRSTRRLARRFCSFLALIMIRAVKKRPMFFE